jgi:uncharacterized protein YrzB (UPF0473 family)
MAKEIFRPGDSPEELGAEVLDELDGEVVTVVDEDGNEHAFQELTRVHLPQGDFLALVPLLGGAEEDETEEDEFIILRLEEEDGETFLSIVEDDALHETAAKACAAKLGIRFEDLL